jgi:hypothetical protein
LQFLSGEPCLSVAVSPEFFNHQMNVFHGKDSRVWLPEPKTLHFEFPHSGLSPRDQLGWRGCLIQISAVGIHFGKTVAQLAGGGKLLVFG